MPSFNTGQLKFGSNPSEMPLSQRLGQQLGFVHRSDALDRFDFDDQAGIDDNVDLVGEGQFAPFIADRKPLLPSVWNGRIPKFKTQAFLVHTLQQPWADLTMNFNRETDHPP